MKFISLILVLVIVSQTEQFKSEIQKKHWLVSCLSCSSHFNFCFNCYGIPQCTECLISIRPECSSCINDIYQDDQLENINGKKYLICDKSKELHNEICHLYCRGKFYATGTCQKLKNKPVCRCKNSNTSFDTTLKPTTKTIMNFNSTRTNMTTFTSNSSNSKQTTTTNIKITTTLSTTQTLSTTMQTSIETCENYNPIKKISNDQKKEINSLIVLTSGELVTASADKSLYVWETSDYNLKKQLSYTYGFWSLLQLSNNTFASGSTSGEILIWNTSNWDTQYKFAAHRGGVEFLIKWNNKYLVSCSQDKTIKIWNPTSFKLVKTLDEHSDHVNYILELKNGNLASCSDDKTIIIWNKKDFSVNQTLTDHTDKVDSLALLKNNDLISCDREGNILIWDKISFAIKKSIRVDSGVYSLLVLSNGNVITGLWNGTNTIWNSSGWNVIKSFGNQTRLSQRFALLPNGDLANGYNDGKLIIWNKCILE